MKPAMQVVLLTVLYWPVALFLLVLMMLPECFGDVAICQASKRNTALVIFGVEVVLYALLLFGILRGRSRDYWLVVIIGIAAIVGLYLAGLGIY